MPTRKFTFRGPFHGIMSDVPPTFDDQGFEDMVNWITHKGRLRPRPGTPGSGITVPTAEIPLNMTSFIDVEGFFHTVFLTDLNAYMLTVGGVLNTLTYPVYIGTATLVNPGTGYTQYDLLNINQAGAFGGTFLVTQVSTNAITGVSPDTGGSGYNVGDILNVVQGEFSSATIQVTAEVGGAITAFNLIDGGNFYSVASGVSTSGGSGTGATINITSVSAQGVITAGVLDNPGSGYTSASGLPTSGGTGTGATITIVTSTFSSLGEFGTATNLPFGLVKANNRVFFCNGSVPVCYIDGEAQFKVAGNVPGSCRYLTTNADHLIGATWNEPSPNSNKAVSYPNRVRWTDVNNYLEWDVSNPSSTAGYSDIDDVPDSISGLSTLGSTTNIYRTNGISQMYATGISTKPFTIRNFSTSPKGEGLLYPYSLTTYNNIDRFIGNYDVWSFDGTNFTPLMDGKCNAQFFADLQVSQSSQLIQNVVRGMITPVLANGFTFLAYVITIPGANVAWVLNITEGSWTRFTWAPPTVGYVGYYDLQFIEQVYTA